MTKDTLPGNDVFMFAEESEAPGSFEKTETIKLLIVDDEKEIHAMTRLVLADYSLNGASLSFLSAYSGRDAKQLIEQHPDIACILLDVVMESEESGLEVARFIRDDMKNDKMRIILRTGQPGKAPEKDIILNYDINDYKEKTELTTQKLFTSITTALRSYRHLVDIETKNQLIIQKNDRLNKEIARRIVAESNLTRYNRSLEKTIETKSDQLRKAIQALKQTETKLKKIQTLADIGKISSLKIDGIHESGSRLKTNLETIDQYRSDMHRLLEKYETLNDILISRPGNISGQEQTTRKILADINHLKLDMDTDLDKMLARYPDIIVDSVKGLETIADTVNDIQLFINIFEEKKSKTDLNTLLETITATIQKQFSKSIDVQMSLSTIPVLNLSCRNIEKAFYEIIKNAFQAVEPKGIIFITTSVEDHQVITAISDLGKGIPDEMMQHLYRPYFNSGKKEARGLGLCFARNVIANNNGSLSIECTRGEGTTVVVKLDISK